MSFLNVLNKYEDFDIDNFFGEITSGEIERIINKDYPDESDFLALLSPKAENCLEEIAQAAHQRTLQNFGRVMHLYTPLYLSNYCVNHCLYCGFNVHSKIQRKKLSMDEVKQEAEYISSKGVKNILILTGESNDHSPVPYIKDCVKILKNYFASICIEIYPLNGSEYNELIPCGVDGLTIYQEVYARDVYSEVHPSGPKKDFKFRLDAPERALLEGIRTVNIGALLGLDRWQRQVFFTGLHALYLQDKCPEAEISISIPRLRDCGIEFRAKEFVTDKSIVQIILALRLFLPRAGITLSTRESSAFRENLIPLGITRMSAGSTTAVGGHSVYNDSAEPMQFQIYDERDVNEIKELLVAKNYQPVFKDWDGRIQGRV